MTKNREIFRDVFFFYFSLLRFNYKQFNKYKITFKLNIGEKEEQNHNNEKNNNNNNINTKVVNTTES